MRNHILGIYAHTLEQVERVCDGIPDARLAEIPHEGSHHAAWVIGHLAIASDMAGKFLGVEAGVPEAWGGWCMPGTGAQDDRDQYPSKDELLETLKKAHAVVAPAFEGASDELLASEMPNEEYREFFPTIGMLAVYMLAHHESYHLGQLSTWRRAIGMPSNAPF